MRGGETVATEKERKKVPLSSRRLRPTLAAGDPPPIPASSSHSPTQDGGSLSPLRISPSKAHVHTYSLPGLVDSSVRSEDPLTQERERAPIFFVAFLASHE